MSSLSVSRTMVEGLRDLVRAVLLEDASTLKKWALQSYDPIERELAKLDIIPIGRGESGSSKLGSGMYNTVREVLYKGRRAAARYSARKVELESLLSFVAYRDKLPSQFRKHFPKVYKTFEFRVDGTVCYGAVVELLEPMPPGLEFDIDHMSLNKTLQRSRVALVDQPSVLKGLIPRQATPEEKKKLLVFFQREVKPLLNQMVGELLSIVDDKLTELAEREQMSLCSLFVGHVFDALRGEVIPSSPDNKRVPSAVAPKHSSKKVRDFYKFVQALEANGLQPEDLHTGNFMVRPGTGDFVVVDPGMFNAMDV